MTVAETKISKLFKELVPPSGKADTVMGEIIRAVSRIGYRCWNDGDHIGVGYGKETCNPAARYLMSVCNDEIANIIGEMWGVYLDEDYDKHLEKLNKAIVDFVEEHPELKETQNDVDMWTYRTNEDIDDEEDEEEWW